MSCSAAELKAAVLVKLRLLALNWQQKGSFENKFDFTVIDESDLVTEKIEYEN